ncbi:hypothetical protein BV25DRAFT_1885276 [Artomyces pyxidatus]|uniref:Uncharacterized protein n=1 Tax=Artomyces pyxidatus TaxID=48021 RepID=A0ACB8T338_9AGAM|nr:hypothetical protein BV25DRAFT_1885276 [Artomyces pyxidatus]
MNSSSGTYSQAGYRPTSFPQVNPNQASGSTSSPSRPQPSPSRSQSVPTRIQPTPKPVSIAELAERAKAAVGESPKGLKHWLRTAEAARHAGKRYTEQGELENAFVEYAKAATIVLEKLPNHKDYRVLLNSAQRHNMGLHGQEILDSLGAIKASLLNSYDDWHASASASAASPDNSPLPPSRGSRISAYSPGSSTPVSSMSTPSSSQSRASFSQRKSRTPSPYRQSTQADTPARRVRDDALRREEEWRREAEQQARHGSTRPEGAEEARQIEWARAEQMRIEREQTSRDDPRRQQDEMRRREEEVRRRVEERRRQEQDGIVRRQQEANAAADAARQSVTVPAPQTPSTIAMPTATFSRGASAGFLQMPLESPTRPQAESAPKPSRTPVQPPITTTSPPPPNFGSIQYPSLMSQHQIAQGYHPSLGSMFKQPPMPAVPHSSSHGLLFLPTDTVSNLYTHLLPKPSAPAPYAATPQSYRPSQPPPLPPKEPPTPSSAQQRAQASARIEQSSDPVSRDLKNVNFPRECLHRFTSIASINTSRNRETCGLLLGKDRGSKFVVTTLLIPKQHSTSDTCTMDEEELVLQFTEERSLITLGWIHTHPTQSCFMSSVDLHTHSGFQRMLPESFAVVCAPKSTPNFGIFRLTDPPGLQTILECNAKEAFHPHPDRPIYTDADKGHVQIKDLTLEIVDLR